MAETKKESAGFRLPQSFLDLLDAESAKMTAALEKPGNFDRIIAASKEAPAKIAALEHELGIKQPAGKIGEIEKAPLGAMREQRRLDEIIEEASRTDPRYEVARITKSQALGVGALPSERAHSWRSKLISAAIGCVFVVSAIAICSAIAHCQSATPKPDLSAQTCEVRAHGQSLTVTCDSSAVCPQGYHLFTRILDPAAAGSIDVMFGYGNDQERENTCMLNSAQAPGLTQGGKQIEVFHVGGAH